MTNQELEYSALKILEQQPDLTQRQLAEKLGVSLGKTHTIWLSPLLMWVGSNSVISSAQTISGVTRIY